MEAARARPSPPVVQRTQPPTITAQPAPEAAVSDVKERPEFWNGLLRAAGAEPRSATDIGGASGVRHPAIAMGVDDVKKRLIVISAEPDARSAALAQADVQSAVPDYKVIVARPLIVSASQVASAIAEAAGVTRFSLSSFSRIQGATQEEANEILAGYFKGAGQILDRWVKNASSVRQVTFTQALKQLIDQVSSIRFESTDDDLIVDLTAITQGAATLLDAELGICGFPLYQLTESDLDAFLDRDIELARDALRRHGVLQFFYPAPDQLVLGAIDRGAVLSESEQPSVLADNLGHPRGDMELVPADTKLTDLIDALRERNLLVEGEVAVELTAEGVQQRASVKFTPREGIVSKIINRISVTIDLKQILGFSIGSGRDNSSPPNS